VNKLAALIPAFAVLVVLAVIGRPLIPKDVGGDYHLDRLGALPVSAGGRTKPLDSVARNSLMVISDRQTAQHGDERLPAIQWLIDVKARPEVAGEYVVFRVDHPDVKSLIGSTDEKEKRFSFNRLFEHREALSAQAARVEEIDPKQRTTYQKHLAELFDHLNLYMSLRDWHAPYDVPPLAEGEDWRPLSADLHPPHDGHAAHAEPGPAAMGLANILLAYQTQDPVAFNRDVGQYAQLLEQAMPEEMRKARFEVLFNRLQPFYQGTVLYVFAFLLGFGALLTVGVQQGVLSRAFGRAAVAVVVLTFVMHTLGLGARIYMQGYAPVTNLYSSAVFTGWFCVVMGLFIEWLFKNNLGAVLSAAIGFTTLIIAHNLADGDTMQMMQAVLDSNFWLSTHVTTVTIGYSATFMAGVFGIVYIIAGVYTTKLDADLAKTLGKMIYGTVAFALLFSFIGTVRGGIWADQSWGRFWGWDPKENGAVLIVLMNALVLHARWAGMIKMRGVAVLAVFGNIVTAWSWFGTNMLGVGLHSYGFMESALFWMLIFVASQLTIMTAGLLPQQTWKSPVK